MRINGVRTIVLLASLVVPASASADVVLLLGGTYGRYGTYSPTGHAAVYLTRVCAASPTELRRCRHGETGSVISRYHRVSGVDWAAIPLMAYLYAVDDASQVPIHADRAAVLTLRDRYRRANLGDLVPDAPGGAAPRGDWVQLIGAAYDRRLIALSISTTQAQDDALIAELNERDNRRRFNLLFRNCADFARDIINFYYPGAIHSNAIADLGFTTPKQIARGLVGFGRRRAQLDLRAFVIQQVPGSRPQSRTAKGVLESLLKTKKYAVPLALVQPWVPVGLAAGYLAAGRFNPDRLATDVETPGELERRALRHATAQ